MILRVHREANLEVTEALSWLIRMQRPEIAGRLYRLWEAALEAIVDSPLMYPLAEDQPDEGECRNYLLPKYGYRIVYQPMPEEIYVVSFARGRRRPGHWHDRLDEDHSEPA
jgi:plasmid stabilization system protein ParE